MRNKAISKEGDGNLIDIGTCREDTRIVTINNCILDYSVVYF